MPIPKKNEHLKRSRNQERKASRLYGGRISPGSGNQWHTKNDVVTGSESIELKTTTKDSYSLKAADIQRVYVNALMNGNKLGWMEIEFAERGVTCIVLMKDDFLELRERAFGELE